MSNSLGTHIILDMYGCDADLIMHATDVQAAMRQASQLARFTIVTEEYHQFSPHGVSGATIIQESNCCFHSWPEYGYVSIDIYYCGENDNIEEAIEFLMKHFNPKHVVRQDLLRGIPGLYEKFTS
jgi:S-adenosylmethionine decarboxylase proenzyme